MSILSLAKQCATAVKSGDGATTQCSVATIGKEPSLQINPDQVRRRRADYIGSVLRELLIRLWQDRHATR